MLLLITQVLVNKLFFISSSIIFFNFIDIKCNLIKIQLFIIPSFYYIR